MPIHYYENEMPRNPPKSPPSLDVLAMPSVPEVSLLLDMGNIKPINLQSYPLVNCRPTEQVSENSRNIQQKEISYGNQNESFKSWKAKNLELLNTVTGSYDSPGSIKRSTSSAISNGICRKMVSHNGVQLPQAGMPTTQPLTSVNLVNRHQEKQFQEENVNLGHQQVANMSVGEHCSNSSLMMPVYHTYPMNSCSRCAGTNVVQPQLQQYLSTVCCQKNMCAPMETIGFVPVNKNIQNQTGYCNRPSQFRPQNIDTVRENNIEECQCGHSNRGNLSHDQHTNPHCALNEAMWKDLSNSHIQANNKVILELYNIISLQNEQISILNEQVKKVLKIHKDCDNNRQQYFNSHSCACYQEKSGNNEQKDCPNVHKDGNAVGSDENTLNHPEINKRTMRSIGVMINMEEQNKDTILKTVKKIKSHSAPKTKKKKQPHIVVDVLKRGFPSYTGGSVKREDKRTLSTSIKPGLKQKHNRTPYVDSSFSLNEAELVIWANSESDDISPNTSVHVDLQDYCSSFSGNSREDLSNSNSNDEDGQNYGDSCSEPQPSWTFYNRVVGQVNNILKKTPPTRSRRQEESPVYRTPAGNVYGLNPEFEAESNWSKRVTFDGPPVNDSDQNVQEQYSRPFQDKQDIRMKDGQKQMQDFMMYKFANGNTNLSFASMRYLDHHRYLQSQKTSKPDPMYQHSYKKSSKRNKNNSSNGNTIADIPSYSSRRKSGRPSSKLLDTTTLREQPKLL